MYIYAFSRIVCRISIHRQLRIRTLFSGGAHPDANAAVFSTLGKPLTVSGLYVIARKNAFSRLAEEPFRSAGEALPHVRTCFPVSRYSLFREPEKALPHLSWQSSWLPMLPYPPFIHVFPPSRFCFADFFCQNKVKPESHKYTFRTVVCHRWRASIRHAWWRRGACVRQRVPEAHRSTSVQESRERAAGSISV